MIVAILVKDLKIMPQVTFIIHIFLFGQTYYPQFFTFYKKIVGNKFDHIKNVGNKSYLSKIYDCFNHFNCYAIILKENSL